MPVNTAKGLLMEIWGFASPSLIDLGVMYLMPWFAISLTYMSPLMLIIEVSLTIAAYVSGSRRQAVCFAVLRQMYHMFVFGVGWVIMVEILLVGFVLMSRIVGLGFSQTKSGD